MQLTKKQLSESFSNILAKKDGLNEVLRVVLDSLMLAERTAYLSEHPEENNKANGYRPGRAFGHGMQLELKVPRDRNGSFYPVLLALLRNQEEQIRDICFELYSKGLSTRDTGDILEIIYGKNYSKSTVSNISKSFYEQMEIWRNRDLSSHYLAIYIDGLFVKVKRNNKYQNECFYIALGVRKDGIREVIAIVNNPVESSHAWSFIFDHMKQRGLQSVGVVVSDALSGIENAVAKSFPFAAHQLCTVHLQRGFMAKVRREDKKEIATDLSRILSPNDPANTIELALCRFEDFKTKWIQKYPGLNRYFNNFDINPYITFLNYGTHVRNMIYTTNWIERFNKCARKVLKIRGALPSDESALALITKVAIDLSENHYAYPIYSFKFEPKLMA